MANLVDWLHWVVGAHVKVRALELLLAFAAEESLSGGPYLPEDLFPGHVLLLHEFKQGDRVEVLVGSVRGEGLAMSINHGCRIVASHPSALLVGVQCAAVHTLAQLHLWILLMSNCLQLLVI